MSKLFALEPTPSKQKNDEWYTPARYIEAAREVLGGIDLDPASCEDANRTIKAARIFTQEENGLAQNWTAKSVWLNPPFSRMNSAKNSGGGATGGKSKVVAFVSKLLAEYEVGHIGQAILLCTADTDAAWFRPLWQYPICFADHRVLFNRPNMPREGQFFGTCFVYLGLDEQKFTEMFSQFGPIAKRVSPARPKLQPDLWSQEESA